MSSPIRKKKIVSRPIAEWSVDQVCSWIDACGHDPSISAAFRRGAVDGAKLLAFTKFELLTNENLIDLGVKDEEARALLSKDIANLKAGHSTISLNPVRVEMEKDKAEREAASLKEREASFDPGYSRRSQTHVQKMAQAETTALREIKTKEAEVWGVRAETEQLKKVRGSFFHFLR